MPPFLEVKAWNIKRKKNCKNLTLPWKCRCYNKNAHCAHWHLWEEWCHDLKRRRKCDLSGDNTNTQLTLSKLHLLKSKHSEVLWSESGHEHWGEREIFISSQTDHTLQFARRPQTSCGDKDRHQISPCRPLLAQMEKRERGRGKKEKKKNRPVAVQHWNEVT